MAALDGVEDQGFCLATPQRLRDDEVRGLIAVGGAWLVVDRATGAVDEWPHLDHIERVRLMKPAWLER